jgi:hypothetical protein
LHDWEIFVGLAKAFAARAQAELKATMPPAQMIDYALRGALWRCVAWKLSLQTLTNIPMASTWGRWRRTSLVACAPPARRSRQPQWPARRPARLARQLPPNRAIVADRPSPCAQQQFVDAQLPSAGERQAAPSVADAPARPAAAQLQDGQRCASVRVRVIEVEVQASEDMMPGVVSLPHGYGHGARACSCRSPGATGVSANDLTDERFRDGVSTALNGVPVQVEAA